MAVRVAVKHREMESGAQPVKCQSTETTSVSGGGYQPVSMQGTWSGLLSGPGDVVPEVASASLENVLASRVGTSRARFRQARK